ncbi:MarR family transcriptional regulator [Streptacidiphilus pinicola]|uniref:MarR family transcriptional regulator n=1 Tax=Streptacidiphilus pinicola TaxID=2219663 RepID=A0A2X0K9G4_9ACTN|nr:MarR family transcriptional regulator [Streptacidiphilus pinicola]RAG85915.1 MarR family transcriptional regulator [Streptacidiphilus pinicola]
MNRDVSQDPGRGPGEAEVAAERLQHAMKRLRARLRTESGQHAVGFAQSHLMVLGTIAQEGPITAARLADLEHVSPQSISQSLAVLKAEGLVRQEPDPQDGRKKLVSADPSALELIDRLMKGRSSFLAQAIDQVVAPDERADLDKAIELLERIATADPWRARI